MTAQGRWQKATHNSAYNAKTITAISTSYTDRMQKTDPIMPTTHCSLTLDAALDAAVCAAHAGAAILQSYAQNRHNLVIDHKARNDLVSQADREAEAAILGVLRTRTPDFGIVAEETGGKADGVATWYIDPLDGTTNFLHGITHYAVSIALIAHAGTALSDTETLLEDTPVIGVIYDPCRDEMFTAVYGIGAWLNGQRITCSNTASINDAVLATGFPFRDFSFANQYMPTLNEAIRTARGVRRMGAASLDLAWTACGRYDGYWEMGLAPWDVAAGTLIVREAKGACHDMHHQDSWPIAGNVVAGNIDIARDLDKMIAPHLDKR